MLLQQIVRIHVSIQRNISEDNGDTPVEIGVNEDRIRAIWGCIQNMVVGL